MLTTIKRLFSKRIMDPTLSHTPLPFKSFKFDRVLSTDYDTKSISILGKFEGSEDNAIVYLVKSAYDPGSDFEGVLHNLTFNDNAFKVKTPSFYLKNDIYHK